MAHQEMVHSTPQHWLRRPDGRVQVGLGPRAWVVEGLNDATERDGPASQLVQHLERAAHRPAPTAQTSFQVVGSGQVANAVRGLVAPSAVPVPSEPARSSTAGEPPRVLDLSDLREHGCAPGPVVLVSPYLVPLGSGRHPCLAGRAVLPVVPQTGRVVVGPWVDQEQGPCLHCLDLHRCDRDPQWPRLAAALDDPLTAPLPPWQPPQVLAVVGALVALLTSSARRPSPGLSHEVGPEPPHVVTRRWPAHPRCPWHQPGTAAGRSPDTAVS